MAQERIPPALLRTLPTFTLLTRFAVRQGSASQHANQTWLENRLELFKRFCAPSVLAQTDPAFTWFLGFDSSISPRFIEKVIDASQGRATPLIVQPAQTFPEACRTISSSELEGLISARLDSDDCLNPGFVATAKKIVRPGHAIFFPRGAQFHLETGQANLRLYPLNQFPVYFSRTGKTVFDLGWHSRIHRGASPINFVRTREPMWLEIIHGGNLKNRWSASAKSASRREIEHSFPMLGGADVSEPSTISRPTLPRLVVYFLRLGAVRLEQGAYTSGRLIRRAMRRKKGTIGKRK
jgi:hypothetical protein